MPPLPLAPLVAEVALCVIPSSSLNRTCRQRGQAQELACGTGGWTRDARRRRRCSCFGGPSGPHLVYRTTRARTAIGRGGAVRTPQNGRWLQGRLYLRALLAASSEEEHDALGPMLCWVLQFRRGRGQGVAMPGSAAALGAQACEGAGCCSKVHRGPEECKMGLIRDQQAVSFVQLQPANSRSAFAAAHPGPPSHSSLRSLPGALRGNPAQCQHAPDRGWCRHLRYCDCGTGPPPLMAPVLCRCL
jgi:hypothetical protein